MTPEPPPVPLPHPGGPLAGYRVLDLADEKGQLCARLLGELGADVIKVEAPDGDPTRANGPFFRGEQGPDRSLFWWAMNAGKRSITCQIKLEGGRDLLHQLVAKSDIVIETNPPGATAPLGLDYATLRAVNPGVVAVSITSFGQTGPRKDWLATDIVASAMGGHMHLNGDAERGPVRTLAPQAYAQVNLQACAGAMIALYARGVNGEGQHVDVSMQEAMTNAMDNAQAWWDIAGVNQHGPGVRRVSWGFESPQYIYETADGWVAAYNALTGRFGPGIIDWFSELGEAGGLDSPEWRERLLTSQWRPEEELQKIEAVVAAFCRKRKTLDLVREAQRRGGGWAPVLGPAAIVENEQLVARDYWVWVRHEDLGESFLYPGAPFLLGETPWRQRGRAPRIGEHNAAVYGELLGMDEAALRRLKTKMVL